MHRATLPLFGKQKLNVCFIGRVLVVLSAISAGVVGFVLRPVQAQTDIPKSLPAESVPEASFTGLAPQGTLGVTDLVKTTAIPNAERVAPTGRAVRAIGLRLTSDAAGTTLELDLTGPIEPQVFTLTAPYRVVIDVPDLEFDVAVDADPKPQGVVAALRYGLLSAGRARIVVEAAGAVRVARSEVVAAHGAMPTRLRVELVASTPVAFAAALVPVPIAAPAISKPGPVAKSVPEKFIVMLDPGHGGADGGAVSVNQIVEKDIVLAVARQLKATLDARGTYDVRMTRATDVFVPLNQRVAMSQAAGAHLFISIHADSVGDAALARTAHGATVYTLSETASHRDAQALADKENAADAAGGLEGVALDDNAQLHGILADLARRETVSFSSDFKQMVIDRLRPVNMLARDPSRAAAFKVLRQPQTPTVLIELGFLTNETDASLLRSAEWQKRIAQAIATAVDTFAAKRQAP